MTRHVARQICSCFSILFKDESVIKIKLGTFLIVPRCISELCCRAHYGWAEALQSYR